MQKLIKTFEDILVAITFAEAGEYDEARKIAGQEQDMESADKQQIAKAASKA